MEMYFGCRLLLVTSLSLSAFLCHAEECIQLTSLFGGEVHFEYNAPENATYDGAFDMNFNHRYREMIKGIKRLDGSKGRHTVSSEYIDRLSVEGNIISLHNPPWNISITLNKLQEKDEGQYYLFTLPEQTLDVCYDLKLMKIGLTPAEPTHTVRAEEDVPDIECHVEPKRNDVEFTWTFNRQLIHNGSVLSLGVAAPGMTGEYECLAHLPHKALKKSVHIYVEEPDTLHVTILTVIGPIVLLAVVLGVVICCRNRKKRPPSINSHPGYDHVRSNRHIVELQDNNEPVEDYDNVDYILPVN